MNPSDRSLQPVSHIATSLISHSPLARARHMSNVRKEWLTRMAKLIYLIPALAILAIAHYSILARFERRHRRHLEEQKRISQQGTTVKEIVRVDGQERIRIFKAANEGFGFVREIHKHDRWIYEHLAGPGPIFDTPEDAEREAMIQLPWLRSPDRKAHPVGTDNSEAAPRRL